MAGRSVKPQPGGSVMAGDWIKVEENMPDKPEVYIMAARLGIDPDSVSGKLLRIWAWASRNCNADGVTSVTVMYCIDRLTAVTGFADSMVEAGWLTVDGDKLVFPNFDRHCSKPAKLRADTNRRVSKMRAKRNAQTVTDVTNVTPPEKRREESNTPLPPTGGKKGPLQLRAEAIFKRRPETPLTAREARAFTTSRGAIEATTEADWLLLEAFYAAPQSETYARKDLATLIANWSGEIDRARLWRPKHHTAAPAMLPFV